MSRRVTRSSRPGRAALIAATALLAAAIAVAGLAVAPSAAWAHAGLEESEPAAGARLERSPEAVLLTFAEDPDPQLSLIRIVDQSGRAVSGASDALPVEGEPAQLSVTLSETLPRGIYTVNWLVVSAEDGHVEDGLFTFGVRETPLPGSAVEVPLRHTSAWTSLFAAAGRWLLYAGLVLLVGAASTGLFVLGGRLPAGAVKVLYGALMAAVAGLCLMAAAERVMVGAPSLLPLFLTSEGKLLVALGAVLLAVAVAVVAFDLWPGRAGLIAIGSTALLAMLVHVWAGHAASSYLRPLGVAAQWVHMVAIGTWVGGLVWLLLGIRGVQTPVHAAAVRVFSHVATVALVVVLATGSLRAIVQVGSVGGLFDTSYGVTLLVKLGLVAVLVALGAVNHYRLVPAFSAADTTYRPFSLNSRGEIVVATAVLATTAVLVGLAPPL